MNRFVLLTLLCLSSYALFSQNSSTFKITGKVVDKEAGIPLEYATITVKDKNSAADIDGGITDTSGNFSVEVPAGNYIFKVEYISFQPISIERTVNSDVNLGTLQLEFAASDLEEVTVVAETTTVDVRLDKKIYNIGKDLTTAGGTVSDALNNVPSVSVDVEGGISLRGNENVRILINGKPSALAGFGSTDVLGQLPADAIERVEVITSPSARYDAEGTAGILNIILRKEKTLGFNGSFQVSGGFPENASVSSNLNYRTEKFNIFNTLGYRYRESPGNAFFDTRYFDPRQDAFLDNVPYDRNVEDRDYDRMDRGFNGNLGLEYYLTERSSVTGSVFYRKGNDDDLTTNANDYFLNNEPRIGTTRRELQNEDDESYQFALNYINRFNDEGHELTADVQYDVDREDQSTFISEPVRYNNSSVNDITLPREETNTIEKQKEYLFQADYVLPIGEDSQFEAGYRGNLENEVTDYELRQENANGVLEINENQTNIFDYTQNVHALYSQYGTKVWGMVNVLLGLRMENTTIKGNITSLLSEQELQEEFSFPIDTDFNNNYLGLFPTVNLILEFGEEENLSFGYNRRINRPNGWFVNPFPSRDSRNNVFQGNPNLDPAFSNAFDIGYLKRWGKELTFTSSVYYQHETDAFQRVQEDVTITGPGGAPTQVIRSIPINLATNDRFGAEAGLLYNPAKWLRLNGSVNFFQFNLDGEFNGQDYSRKNTSWFGRFSSKVTLPGAIDWQTNLFYRGASQEIQGRQDGILSIDLALSKELFDGSTTISANVSDLLNSRKRQSFTSTEFFEQDSEFQWRQRQVNLSLIYRFNQRREDRNQERERNSDNYGDDEGDFQGK